MGSLCLLLVLASPVLCLTADEGPCRLPEPVRLLPAAAGAAPVVAANFGLLFPPRAAGAPWQYLCDDLYRTAPPERVWRAGAGGPLFAGGEGASQRGLLISEDDGCSWRAAAGDVAGQAIVDLAFAEDAPAIWALGVTPAAVYLSSDGGAHFRLQRAFPGAAPPARLLVAPSSRGRRLYLGAREAPAGAAAMWVSDDGGTSWSPSRPRAGNLVAVAPADPETVFFQVSDPLGDELWRSGDGGATAARVLKLPDFELFAGLAFGAGGGGGAADTLHVAGRAPVVVEDLPPGRLYVSRDGGATWLPPVRSGPRGPSYRCLERREGRLWACGAGEGAGEDFLLGVSADEGQTWSSVLRLGDVRGARACARAACVATENWLCEGFGSCADAPADAAAGTGVDAADALPNPGGAGAEVRRGAGGGCDCTVSAGGARARSGAATPLALASALVFLRGLRRKTAATDTHRKHRARASCGTSKAPQPPAMDCARHGRATLDRLPVRPPP